MIGILLNFDIPIHNYSSFQLKCSANLEFNFTQKLTKGQLSKLDIEIIQKNSSAKSPCTLR